MISYEESVEIINSIDIKPKEIIELPLMEAQNLFLAEDIVADFNSPEYPTSAMDGYALKYEDQALKELKISAINPAGADEILTLTPGEVIKTFTGSIMPEGSDTLIPIENVTVNGNKIVINEEVPFGFSVREVGENFKKGEVLIKKGTKIDFAQIAVLASLNYVTVKVYQPPKVAIVATGSELLELGEEQTKQSQIRSSNNYTIEAIVKNYNAEAIQLGCVGDNVENIKKVFKNALNEADIIVSTGGVSVGDFDFVKDVVRDELGAEVVFKGVVLKPGQHIMVAKVDNKVILALPGFAYSSTVTALIYMLPIIHKYMDSAYKPLIVKSKLRGKYTKKSKKTEFTPCNLSVVNGNLSVDFIGKKNGTSAIMTNMLGNCALTVTSSEDGDKEIGEKIDTFIYSLNVDYN